MNFEERIDALRRRMLHEELVVLVWGPGTAAGPDFGKRQQVKDAIKGQFVNADVRFSEEIPLSPIEAATLSVPEQELWHLYACDLCVILDTSKGPGEEIAHFINTNLKHK